MPVHVLSNPQSFVREAEKQNITHAYLIEAFECIGQQKMCQMFAGRSSRGQEGTLSSGTLINWKKTFEFIRDHPDHVDNQHYQARSIVKNGADWDRFVEIIKRPISDETVRSWDNLTRKQLGDEAIRHGITVGVRNGNAIKILPQRMRDMVERRRKNIWAKAEKKVKTAVNLEDEMRFNKNVFELRQMCAQRGIPHGGNTTKEEMISALLKPVEMPKKEYTDMSSAELKRLAKDRQLLRYNNLNKPALVELHQKYDDEVKKEQETPQESTSSSQVKPVDTKEFLLTDAAGNNHPIIIRKDGMANATMLARAYNKAIHDYLSNTNSKQYINAVMNDLGYDDTSKLIEIKKGGDTRFTGTWVHHLIAIDIARWAYPPASVQMNKWITEYVTTGTIQARRPCSLNFDLSEMDVEAEEMEGQYDWGKHSNTCVLYMAYIGDGLVKVGVSDCNLLKREVKHTSSGSQFPQMRIVETFEISSICVEKTIHQLLQRFRVVFNKQKEIYKPPNTIKNFISHVKDLLKEHDLKMEIKRLQQAITDLQLENCQLKLKIATDA